MRDNPGPVSYTHLDVYKRQAYFSFGNLENHILGTKGQREICALKSAQLAYPGQNNCDCFFKGDKFPYRHQRLLVIRLAYISVRGYYIKSVIILTLSLLDVYKRQRQA